MGEIGALAASAAAVAVAVAATADAASSLLPADQLTVPAQVPRASSSGNCPAVAAQLPQPHS